MARVGRPSTFILHSLGTRAGTGPRVNVFDDVRTADSAPLPPPGHARGQKESFWPWFPCSRFGLKRPTSTRLTFILGPIMKYHHFMGPVMLGTCWGIIRYQFWNENPLLLLENQALLHVQYRDTVRL